LSIIGPWDLKKRSLVQIQWFAGEISASPLPMSLTWVCQWLVRLGPLLGFQNNFLKIFKLKSVGNSQTNILSREQMSGNFIVSQFFLKK
jgi:hypothetical protein